MLIKALCDYYDELSAEGNILPECYSKVNVHFLICLSPEGEIANLINWQEVQITENAKGKIKEKLVPRETVMPLRTEKSGIESNIIEHRPLYIFGLNLTDKGFTPDDRTHKAEKSHNAFVGKNLKFIKGLDSPLINAYRKFIEKWKPADETKNKYLLSIGKLYKNAYFAFCMNGCPDKLLHEDSLIKERWENKFNIEKASSRCDIMSQCAISGQNAPIARVHSKLKGVYGGLATGSVLIGFNNSSECSYCNEQSYNSNISADAMRKYTEAFNYLLNNKKHKALIDDMTIVFWASGGIGNERCSQLFSYIMFDEKNTMNKKETDEMLENLMLSAYKGNITQERISTAENIDTDVDFYMVGIKPNSSRLALKFIYRKKFGEILENIAKFQSDMQITDKISPVPLWKLKGELTSPKSSSENRKVDPSLMAEIFKSVIQGISFPKYLLSTLVRRVKTDKYINNVRAGAIKACINRELRLLGQKEEIKLSLDYNNKNQAYLCGRLFAVLEKLQQEVSGNSLNRTIKDAYFSSASSKPAIIFPKLINLAQNHLKKVGSPVYFNKLIQEIIEEIDGEFPETLILSDQGKFIIGYYQQFQSFFNKSSDKNNITQGEK